jgi:hypothetical protein
MGLNELKKYEFWLNLSFPYLTISIQYVTTMGLNELKKGLNT